MSGPGGLRSRNPDGRRPEQHPIDGRMMTAKEIAQMLGITPGALKLRKSRLGGCSYQLIVDMWRDNAIGNDRCHRYLIDGRWVTRGQLAEELHILPSSLSNWRYRHRQPDGSLAPMEDAVAWFREYLTGEHKRYPLPGGGRPWKKHRVNGRDYTVKDVAEHYGKCRSSVYARLQHFGGDMAQVVAWYEAQARRKKAAEQAVERRKARKAERDIMRILGF